MNERMKGIQAKNTPQFEKQHSVANLLLPFFFVLWAPFFTALLQLASSAGGETTDAGLCFSHRPASVHEITVGPN